MTTTDNRFGDEIKIESFYSNSNMEQLKKANQQVKNGQVIVKTIEELEAMEIE